MCIFIMVKTKIRIDITIEETLLNKFREKYVRKKGDLSNKIEELIKNALQK